MKAVLGLLALLALVPVASACEGLSPGDEIRVGDARCTLAFLLADRTGLYFATAGHCIDEGQAASNPDVGTFGVGFLHYLNPERGEPSDGAPGEDFGLILVDPAFHDQLNPKVCELEGPTGIYEATPGSGGVMHHGYGLILGDLETTRTRRGVDLSNNNTAFYWTGAGVPGDSGSGVLHDSGLALGVLTHLQVHPNTNGGTHLHRGFQLAKEMKGLDLRLVLMGEDPVEVLRQLRAEPAPEEPASNETATPPTRASTNETAPPSSNPPPSSQPPRDGAVPPPRDDDLAPAANLDEGNKVPAPGVLVALVAVALALAARRRA